MTGPASCGRGRSSICAPPPTCAARSRCPGRWRSIRRARLWATARGVYELRLNGERAGDALLAPGWSDYRSRLRYQTYDVGPLLRDGANTLGAILGTGWYAGHIGWLGQTAFYGPHPRLLAQLTVEFDDGTSVTIGTDDGWQATTGPIDASDLLMGEHYDARKERRAGTDRGTDSTPAAGSRSVTEARDGTPLVADRAEPVRALIELPRCRSRRGMTGR